MPKLVLLLIGILGLIWHLGFRISPSGIASGLSPLAMTRKGCHCEHLKGAWQSPVLVIYILGFDIVWDLDIRIRGFLLRVAPVA
jgi:hypothetical protein